MPGVGWAAGVERILLAAGEQPGTEPGVEVFIAMDGGDRTAAFKLLNDLRAAGVPARMEQAGRAIKGQFKQADRLNAARVVVVAEDEWRLRDMGSGEQQTIAGPDEVLALYR